MKDAKELAGEIYDKYGKGDNSSVELIERDREGVRAEERRAFAEHLIQVLGAECEPHTMVRWGALVEDIRAEAAILFPEPIEPSEPEGIFIPASQWPSINTTDADKIRFFDYWRAEVEARIAKEGNNADWKI